jgi:hypothetical protein
LNCRDAERLLDTFFDGELDGRLMREAALHVTRCKRCEAEIADRERLQDLLVAAVEGEIAAVDPARIWDGVEAAIGERVVDLPRRRGVAARAESVGWLRLAATSTRASGFLVRGRRSAAADDRAFEDALDPAGEWLVRETPATRRHSWSMGVATALAASLAAAVYFGLGDGGAPDGKFAGVATPPTEAAAMRAAEHAVAVAPSQGAPVAAPGTLDRGATAVASAGQVQVESVDYSGRSLAMWTEPETDTTVIWVEEDDPSLAVKSAASR